jgi:hypothetical protein
MKKPATLRQIRNRIAAARKPACLEAHKKAGCGYYPCIYPTATYLLAHFLLPAGSPLILAEDVKKAAAKRPWRGTQAEIATFIEVLQAAIQTHHPEIWEEVWGLVDVQLAGGYHLTGSPKSYANGKGHYWATGFWKVKIPLMNLTHSV